MTPEIAIRNDVMMMYRMIYMKEQRNMRLAWLLCYATAFTLLAVLVLKTSQRVVFPWDVYNCPESPFLTDMMKLNQHRPVYSPPSDGNSFIYSPGLEYICYALLEPAGVALDIRYSRLISIGFGIAASFLAALAILRVAKPAGTRPWLFFLACWAVVLLALGKNPTFDVVHPDNLHVFHGLLLFWSCLVAVEKRSFRVAILTMVVGGLGPLAKQTEAFCVLGPALVFAWLNPWGWRRWSILAAVGLGTLCLSLVVLWQPPFASFYTCTLLTHQGVSLKKLALAFVLLTRADFGLLQLLALIASVCLWQAGGRHRVYMICWMGVGLFVVFPALAAFIKIEGAVNNLILFRIWMFLVVLPFFAALLDGLLARTNGFAYFPVFKSRGMQLFLCLVTILSLAWLWPDKRAPLPDLARYCRQIDSLVKGDIESGRRVLLGHGTTFLIHAGSREIPLDRSNSILEMNVGGSGNLSGMGARLARRDYDKIYLLASEWYGVELLRKMNERYQVETVIKGAAFNGDAGYQSELTDNCLVLRRRSD